MPSDPTGLLLLLACLALAALQAASRAAARGRRRAAAREEAGAARAMLAEALAEMGGGFVELRWKRGGDAEAVFTVGGRPYRVRVRGAPGPVEAADVAARAVRQAMAGDAGPTPQDADATGAEPEPATWRDVLGVGPAASLRQAEAAWRRLAKAHHPDLGGDQARMAALNEARDEARRELA